MFPTRKPFWPCGIRTRDVIFSCKIAAECCVSANSGSTRVSPSRHRGQKRDIPGRAQPTNRRIGPVRKTGKFGRKPARDHHYVRDLHATVLHLMELDHRKLHTSTEVSINSSRASSKPSLRDLDAAMNAVYCHAGQQVARQVIDHSVQRKDIIQHPSGTTNA